MAERYDVAVIGGGPGGYAAAIRCAQLGKKTVLIEKKELGGTCLNRGCIPTKTLLHSAEVYRTVKNAAEFGITAGEAGFDYGKMAARKDNIVAKLRSSVSYLVKGAGADILPGEGVLRDKNTIIVNGAAEISAENIILASGSKPASLHIPGIDLPGVMDSDGVLSMKECPDSAVIIGGGAIGVEFASLFNALGKKVTIIEMMGSILPEVDAEIASMMQRVLKRRGIGIFTGAKVTGIEVKGLLKCLYELDGVSGSAEGEICVVAVGRKPDTEGLGLEAAGVKTQKGFVAVDTHMRTNISSIFAVGDITGKAQLAHAATAQGLIAAHNAAGQNKKMEYGIVPSCIYTSPEIACVGLTEKEASEKAIAIKIGRSSAGGNGRSKIMGERDGIVKLITDKTTGKILGAHIMAARATDMIAEICVAMKAGATIRELADTIHPHPTFSEMVMEAAQDAGGL